MRAAFIVGLGSFAGGITRFFVEQFIQTKMPAVFPYGTLAVNMSGCFLIGLLFSLGLKGYVPNDWRLFLVTGICGGYTTFSAFSMETITLFRLGNWSGAVAYITASVILGLLATLFGIWLIKFF